MKKKLKLITLNGMEYEPKRSYTSSRVCMKCDLNDYCDKGNILGDFCCRTFGESMYFVKKDAEGK